jgi:hypothetical protein
MIRRDIFIITSYSALCLAVLVLLIFTPTQNSKYLYIILQDHIKFEEFVHLMFQANARIIDNGAFENSYIIYAENGFSENHFNSNTLVRINPVFAQGCSSIKGLLNITN